MLFIGYWVIVTPLLYFDVYLYRKKMFKTLFFSFLICTSVTAQTKVDSIYMKLSEKPLDTVRIMLLYDLAEQYYINRPDTAITICETALEESKAVNFELGVSDGYSWLAYLYQQKGDFIQAIELQEQSLTNYEKIKDTSRIILAYSNLGELFRQIGNIEKSIVFSYKGLELSQTIKDTNNIINSQTNIALLYSNLKEYDKSIDMLEKSLILIKKKNNLFQKANAYNNLGAIYGHKKEHKIALTYYKKTKKAYEELNNKDHLIIIYNNIGNGYEHLGYLDSAFNFYSKGLDLAQSSGNQKHNGDLFQSLANYYNKKGDNLKAEYYSAKALDFGIKNNKSKTTLTSSSFLYKLYKINQKPYEALKTLELYMDIKDSIFKLENKKKLYLKDFEYEYAKKKKMDSLEKIKDEQIYASKIKLKDEQLKRESDQRKALYAGLGLIFVFSLFIVNRVRVISKQKKKILQVNLEVERQHNIISEKQGEIIDSINYAKKLQEAILPPLDLIHSKLKESFVYYQPKDIVSGDFYWMECKNGRIFLAAADCTGHGVPGAMVSVVCANALNKTVNELGKTDPGEILNSTRNLVIATFAKAGKEVKDGMDISLLSFAENKIAEHPIYWAGANNPLWIIRSCDERSRSKVQQEVEEIKPDKQPIGLYGTSTPFTTHKVQASHGDLLYIFSDGYIDQFGGEKGKKFKSKSLKSLLISLSDKTMEAQRESLHFHFEQWKGQHEQLDDVCLIGVRV